jgi:hypothetical protein
MEAHMTAKEAETGCEAMHPYLEISGPGGESFSAEVPEGACLTIGRNPENDIVLGSDPQVSRVHCSVTTRDGNLCVTDKGSTNGTLVYQDSEWRWVRSETVCLGNGDIIRISGRPRHQPNGGSSPGFWDLTFRDPFATQPVQGMSWGPRLELMWQRGKVFRIEGAGRSEIAINRDSQEYRLLRYMDERNQAAGGVAVDCSHAELIAAVWEGAQAHGHTRNDIAHLVRDLRMRLESSPESPRFLVTVRGGYKLITQPLPDLTALA